MKQKLLTFIISLAITIQAGAQERTVENRPYTDLRPFHFGVLVGTHFQDIEFQNAGLVTYLDADGIEQQSCVTVDQDRWDTGFTVGVLGEFRLNTHFQLRIAPAWASRSPRSSPWETRPTTRRLCRWWAFPSPWATPRRT